MERENSKDAKIGFVHKVLSVHNGEEKRTKKKEETNIKNHGPVLTDTNQKKQNQQTQRVCYIACCVL